MKNQNPINVESKELQAQTEDAGKWFAGLPRHEQEFALELWKMIERADENHVIEVKTLGDGLRATLIYLLRKSEVQASQVAGGALTDLKNRGFLKPI